MKSETDVPIPSEMPDHLPLLIVFWMQSTPIGPSGIEPASPTATAFKKSIIIASDYIVAKLKKILSIFVEPAAKIAGFGL